MSRIILFDEPVSRTNLLPFTYTRPTAFLRCGIFTIAEKWSHQGTEASILSEPYLQVKFPFQRTDSKEYLFVNGALCPNQDSLALLSHLSLGESIWKEDVLVAFKTDQVFQSPSALKQFAEESSKKQSYNAELGSLIEYVWDISELNGVEILSDFTLVTQRRKSAVIQDKYSTIYGRDNIFLEEGVDIKAAIINAEDGVVYLGRNAKVSEGSIVKNTLAVCEGGEVAFGAKIKGDTTIGPFARVGGEVGKSVFFGRSNKIHDGYLGNSVIGEWCNLGAATNNSNLKNTYSNVKVWNYKEEQLKDTQLQFCGLFMGDHSKCGINTMFNTGTIVGFSANIFGSGFPPKFIPSFAWGGKEQLETGEVSKLSALAKKVTERKGIPFTPADLAIFETIFHQSATYRTWEKE